MLMLLKWVGDGKRNLMIYSNFMDFSVTNYHWNFNLLFSIPNDRSFESFWRTFWELRKKSYGLITERESTTTWNAKIPLNRNHPLKKIYEAKC